MHHEFISCALGNCSFVADLSALAACTGLRTLDLSYCVGVADVSALAACTGLLQLNLSGCFTAIPILKWDTPTGNHLGNRRDLLPK